jgi:hypothetical protein
MKKLFTILSVVCITVNSFAQQQQCATMSVLQQQMQNAQYAESYQKTNAAAAQWRANHPEAIRSSAPVVTIPVVVHVLYKNATQNISDQQIYSQIAILNQDYRRMNADTINTPSMFDTIAADINVEFKEIRQTELHAHPLQAVWRSVSSVRSEKMQNMILPAGKTRGRQIAT